MDFKTALNLMKNHDAMVKRVSWNGYWKWDNEKQTIMIHCREKDSETGKDVLDIRETQRVAYTIENMLEEDWEIATADNCRLLGGVAQFDFDTANKYMKRGLRVKRNYFGSGSLWIKGDEYMTNKECLSDDGTVCILRPSDIAAKDWTFER